MTVWEMKDCGVEIVIDDATEGEEERRENGESDGEVGAGDEEFG